MRKSLLLLGALVLAAAVPSGTFAQGGKFVGDMLGQTLVPIQSVTGTAKSSEPAKATKKAKRSKKAKKSSKKSTKPKKSSTGTKKS